MTRKFPRSLALALAASMLAFGLSACGASGDGDKADTGIASAKIAPVAPPAGKVWGDVVVKTPEGGYLMGNPAAPIKLVEYGSLTCSHCAEFAEASGAELRDKFVASGRVSFELRNFVRDAIDLTAAQLTRCGAPESYFALTDQAFANQAAMFQKAQAAGDAYGAAMNLPAATRGKAIAEVTGLSEFFASRGISRDQAAICLADAGGATSLAENTRKQGEEFNIEGTPAFLINGQKANLAGWPEVKARLETMGAR
jgi:protein-disulfide isomerase